MIHCIQFLEWRDFITFKKVCKKWKRISEDPTAKPEVIVYLSFKKTPYRWAFSTPDPIIFHKAVNCFHATNIHLMHTTAVHLQSMPSVQNLGIFSQAKTVGINNLVNLRWVHGTRHNLKSLKYLAGAHATNITLLDLLPSSVTRLVYEGDLDEKFITGLVTNRIEPYHLCIDTMPSDMSSFVYLEKLQFRKYIGPTKFPPSLHTLVFAARDHFWITDFQFDHIKILNIRITLQKSSHLIKHADRIAHIPNISLTVRVKKWPKKFPEFLLPAIKEITIDHTDIPDAIIRMPNLRKMSIRPRGKEHLMSIYAENSGFQHWPHLSQIIMVGNDALLHRILPLLGKAPNNHPRHIFKSRHPDLASKDFVIECQDPDFHVSSNNIGVVQNM